MSLCKELETSVFRCHELLSNLRQLQRHRFSQCHMEMLRLKRHSCRFLQRQHFSVFPGGETAPVTTRLEISKIAQLTPSFSVPVSRPMPSTFGVPSTLPADPVAPTGVPSTWLPDSVVAPSHADLVVAHDHAPTQFDEESAVDTQFDDPYQFDDPPVLTPVIPSQSKPVYDHRDDLPHHIRTQLQSRIRMPAQNLKSDAKRFALGCWQTSSFDVVSRCFIQSRVLQACDSPQIL